MAGVELKKTPDEIKKGLQCMSDSDIECDDCPYRDDSYLFCSTGIVKDANVCIQQLETENHQLLTKVQQLQRERDAALAQLNGHCWCCKKGKPLRKGSSLMICPHFGAEHGIVATLRSNCPHWEWNEGKEPDHEQGKSDDREV